MLSSIELLMLMFFTKYVLFHNFMHGIRTLAVLIYRCIIGNANYIVKYIPFSIYRVPY